MYIPVARHGLGAVIEVTGTESDLTIAKLQLAINRVIRGARQDSSLPDVQRDAARAATMVKESGILGPVTAAAFRSAKLAGGVLDPPSLTTITQIELATRNLNAVADLRGYSSPDTVKLASAGRKLLDIFGAGDQPKEGLPIVPIAIAVAALGVGFALYRRSR